VPVSERWTSSARIEARFAPGEHRDMKKLILFSDSCIYIQTVDEEPATEKPED
jgi:hypothetical protein